MIFYYNARLATRVEGDMWNILGVTHYLQTLIAGQQLTWTVLTSSEHRPALNITTIPMYMMLVRSGGLSIILYQDSVQHPVTEVRNLLQKYKFYFFIVAAVRWAVQKNKNESLYYKEIVVVVVVEINSS